MSLTIVQQDGEELFTTSEAVAEGAGVDHRSVTRLIDTYRGDLEEFGGVRSEIRPLVTPGGVQEKRTTRLNEQQSTLLLTYLRNTEQVRTFKKNLVRAFYEMARQLRATQNPLARPELVTRADLARMVLESEEQLEKQRPIVDYHQRYVAESDDIITVDNFASQVGSTGPKVRELLEHHGIAIRRVIGQRYSKSKDRLEDIYEWRARQGKPSSDWFVLRPQHNAPRHHNNQVRQTLYVRQFYANDLARKLGLTYQQEMDLQGVSA